MCKHISCFFFFFQSSNSSTAEDKEDLISDMSAFSLFALLTRTLKAMCTSVSGKILKHVKTLKW